MAENSAGNRYIYKTRGVCPAEIHFRIDANLLKDLRFVGGGCPGNSLLVSRLLNERTIDEIPAVLRGIECRDGTSCPDQLARALAAVKNRTLGPADTFRIHEDPRNPRRVALIGDLAGDGTLLERVLKATAAAVPDGIYCVGNITGNSRRNKEIVRMLEKEGVLAVQGDIDWRYAHGTEPPDWPTMEPSTRDRLLRLPQVLRFDLAGQKTIAFYGDYLQNLEGYSDYDPFALEMNMVCGLADFMRDETVFPALSAMTPQFEADLILFGQTDRWGHWRVGGKEIIAVGPASDGARVSWGLLGTEDGCIRLEIMTSD